MKKSSGNNLVQFIHRMSLQKELENKNEEELNMDKGKGECNNSSKTNSEIRRPIVKNFSFTEFRNRHILKKKIEIEDETAKRKFSFSELLLKGKEEFKKFSKINLEEVPEVESDDEGEDEKDSNCL